MNLPLAPVQLTRFHLSLNVNHLEKAVAFYQILFDAPPAKLRVDYAKFEIDEPPLVLSLEPNGRAGAGSLNHVGIRLHDARQLVAVQERIERAGVRTQRQEGVECCYARQSKFWVCDPDDILWEFYILEDDQLEHRGAGQVPADAISCGTTDHSDQLSDTATVWEHLLGSPIPSRIDACDGSLDEVRLQGSFNMPLTPEQQHMLLAESQRVLKPGGRLLVRILAGDQPLSAPNLPGKGAPIQFVPAKDDVVRLIVEHDLHGLRLLKYDDPPCFVAQGVAMRETHIEAFQLSDHGE